VSDVTAALRSIYAQAQAEIDSLDSLKCEMSGLCCRFREAGHRLYLTALEYEEMVAHGGTAPLSVDGPSREDGACPWLKDGLCANREGRALACRTYFCSDEAAAAEVTERGHERIRELHDCRGIPYQYASLEEFRNSDSRISSEEA
jgi:Fe-S-cluster containining protein